MIKQEPVYANFVKFHIIKHNSCL